VSQLSVTSVTEADW